MRRHRRTLAAVAATVALTAGTTLVAAQAEASGPAETIEWSACESKPEAECGTLTVPIDWSEPDGKTIELAVARVPATNPDQRIGSLMVNPGGPGGSGVAFALSETKAITADMRARFDIVGFDPRGVEASAGILCDQDKAAAAIAAQYPKSHRDYFNMRHANKAYGESCREQSGPIFDQLDTADTVQDMDAIRAALGEEKLTYMGISYGTMLGQQYAEAYPDNVRALLLDSVIDHTLNAYEWNTTASEAQEKLFGQMDAWCDEDTECALHSKGLTETWDRLYARAEDGDLPDPDDPTRAMLPEELGEALVSSAYTTTSWPPLMEYLASLDSGESTAAVKALAEIPDEHIGRGDPQFLDAYRSVLCQDFDFDLGRHGYHRLESWLPKLEEKYAPHTKFNTFNWTDVTGCQKWPAKTSNPQRPFDIDEDVSILFLNSRYDAITPHSWAANAAAQADKPLLTYEGSGHSTVAYSPCIADYADAYLAFGELPPPGVTCPAEPVR